jgi:hypothetical protein
MMIRHSVQASEIGTLRNLISRLRMKRSAGESGQSH